MSLACLLQLIHLSLVKFELTSLFLCEVCEVEGNSHEVTLLGIVALIVIIVNDHVVSVIFCGGNVLEIIQIEWVSQDVIGVDTLQGLAFRLVLFHHNVVLFLSQEGHVEGAAAVLLFPLAPLAVLVVEAGPIVVNIFIKLDVSDCERGEAGLDLLADPVTTYLKHEQKNEAKKQ